MRSSRLLYACLIDYAHASDVACNDLCISVKFRLAGWIVLFLARAMRNRRPLKFVARVSCRIGHDLVQHCRNHSTGTATGDFVQLSLLTPPAGNFANWNQLPVLEADLGD